jgi:hypothetical protein
MSQPPPVEGAGRGYENPAKLVPLDAVHRTMRDMLLAFLQTQASDPVAMECLRQEYCGTCCTSEEADRDRSCATRRCGLRNPQRFTEEQAVLGRALDWIAPVPEGAPPEEIARLNAWVAQAGCATVALVCDDAGYCQVRHEVGCLRAALHGAVVSLLGYYAGDQVHFNLDGMKRGAARALVRDRYEVWSRVKKERAKLLRRLGISDQRIANGFGRKDDKTIWDWLGPRSEGEN